MGNHNNQNQEFLTKVKMRLSLIRAVYWNTPKGPKAPLYRPFKYFNLAEPEKYGGVGKPTAYIKNAMHDAPELVTGIALMVLGYICAGYMYYQEKTKGIARGTPYKMEYVIVRPDDPLVSCVVD